MLLGSSVFGGGMWLLVDVSSFGFVILYFVNINSYLAILVALAKASITITGPYEMSS